MKMNIALVAHDEMKNTNIRVNGILPPKLNIAVPNIIAAIIPLLFKDFFLYATKAIIVELINPIIISNLYHPIKIEIM